jgi:hypothetical protein
MTWITSAVSDVDSEHLGSRDEPVCAGDPSLRLGIFYVKPGSVRDDITLLRATAHDEMEFS